MITKIAKYQLDILEAKTRGRIFVGSLGCGKTFTLAMVAIREALLGRHTMIVSHTYTNLRDVILFKIKELLETYEIPYVLNISHMTIIVNNTPILLRSSTDPERLRSYTLDSVLVDEAFLATRKTFDILLGRLRRGDDGFYLLVTTTHGKDYVYDIIKTEGLEHIFSEDLRCVSNEHLTVIRATIDDSPFLPQSYVDDLRRQYTSKFAAQELDCKIIDNEGEILSPSWLKVQTLPESSTGVRYWDLAVSTKESADFSASCFMYKKNNKFYIMNMQKVKLSYPDLKRLIIDTAHRDGPGVTIYIEDCGQQRAILDDLRASYDLHNHIIKSHKPTKDKITRAYPLASQAELGNVIVNDEPWVKQYKDELSMFSVENVLRGNTHDDMVDASTGAYACLSQDNTVRFAKL
jgi:predicted phage terminase large subunit-like protein